MSFVLLFGLFYFYFRRCTLYSWVRCPVSPVRSSRLQRTGTNSIMMFGCVVNSASKSKPCTRNTVGFSPPPLACFSHNFHPGPIVRINPRELHIDDPEFYDTVYNNTGKWDKHPPFATQFHCPGSGFATVTHDRHRLRRKEMNRFFSRQAIDKQQAKIQVLVQRLCERMNEFKGSSRPFPLKLAYSCFAADVVTSHFMPVSVGLLEDPDFAPRLFQMTVAANEFANMARHFPWIYPVLERLPARVCRWISPTIAYQFEDFQVGCPSSSTPLKAYARME